LVLLFFSFFLSLFLFLAVRFAFCVFFTIASPRRVCYALSVTAQPTKNNPQVVAQERQHCRSKNQTKKTKRVKTKQKKENNTR
jgi:hypothetical protein